MCSHVNVVRGTVSPSLSSSPLALSCFLPFSLSLSHSLRLKESINLKLFSPAALFSFCNTYSVLCVCFLILWFVLGTQQTKIAAKWLKSQKIHSATCIWHLTHFQHNYTRTHTWTFLGFWFRPLLVFFLALFSLSLSLYRPSLAASFSLPVSLSLSPSLFAQLPLL